MTAAHGQDGKRSLGRTHKPEGTVQSVLKKKHEGLTLNKNADPVGPADTVDQSSFIKALARAVSCVGQDERQRMCAALTAQGAEPVPLGRTSLSPQHPSALQQGHTSNTALCGLATSANLETAGPNFVFGYSGILLSVCCLTRSSCAADWVIPLCSLLISLLSAMPHSQGGNSWTSS